MVWARRPVQRSLVVCLAFALAACRGRGDQRPAPIVSAVTAPKDVASVTPCADPAFAAGDAFVFGPETAGLPDDVLATFAPEARLRLPELGD